MRRSLARKGCTLLFMGVLGALFSADAVAQDAGREGRSNQAVAIPAIVKGGQVQPHWLAGAEGFWHAE